jgi:hypothetical protein
MHATDWEEEHVTSVQLADGNWWTVTYTIIVKDEKPVEMKVTKLEVI